MDADDVARARMVDALVRDGVIHDVRIAAALRDVPRHRFLPLASVDEAHLDAPAPIGSGQTISAPHMVALMADALDVRPGHRVLEIGGGSGYHAAILARLAAPGRVVSVEIVPELAADARRTLGGLGIGNVDVVEGDGSLGHPPLAPYDRISVAAGAPDVPPPLVEQLADEGILVLPIGPLDMQTLMRVRKDGAADALMPVRFVPLRGAHGWPA